MKCPKCQYENREGDKFCRECGARLEGKCPECGHVLEPQDKFCGGCGARLGEAEPTAIPRLEEVHARLQRSMPGSLAAQMQAAADNCFPMM